MWRGPSAACVRSQVPFSSVNLWVVHSPPLLPMPCSFKRDPEPRRHDPRWGKHPSARGLGEAEQVQHLCSTASAEWPRRRPKFGQA